MESSTEKLNDIRGSSQIGGDINPEERNMVQRVYDIKINTIGTVPQIKQKQVKVKRGRKPSKLKETVRNSKVSLLEKISIAQIKDTSIWHTRY